MDVIEPARSSDSGEDSDSSTDEMSRSFWSASALSSQNLVTNQATQREQVKKGKALQVFFLLCNMYAKVMRNKDSATCTFINSATTTTFY